VTRNRCVFVQRQMRTRPFMVRTPIGTGRWSRAAGAAVECVAAPGAGAVTPGFPAGGRRANAPTFAGSGGRIERRHHFPRLSGIGSNINDRKKNGLFSSHRAKLQ
jgi:hypothetical protein